jgi:hypothetical protein
MTDLRLRPTPANKIARAASVEMLALNSFENVRLPQKRDRTFPDAIQIDDDDFQSSGIYAHYHQAFSHAAKERCQLLPFHIAHLG